MSTVTKDFYQPWCRRTESGRGVVSDVYAPSTFVTRLTRGDLDTRPPKYQFSGSSHFFSLIDHPYGDYRGINGGDERKVNQKGTSQMEGRRSHGKRLLVSRKKLIQLFISVCLRRRKNRFPGLVWSGSSLTLSNSSRLIHRH